MKTATNYIVAFVFVFLLCGVIFWVGTKIVNPLPVVKSEMIKPTSYPIPTIIKLNRDVLLRDINEWRMSVQKSPYVEDERLCEFARVRIEQIKTDWSHNLASALMNNMFTKKGIAVYLAENLAQGQVAEKTTLQAWLKSPPHKKNLDADFKYTCVETDGTYAVQIFGNL